MSAVTNLRRQWIPMAGGSCDVRMGYDALDQASAVFKGAAGNPRACLVVLRSSIAEDVRELLRRQLVNAGYSVSWHELATGRVSTLEEATSLAASCAQYHITGDDLIVALGDAQAMALASYVAGSWCGATSLVAVPTDETALLEGALVPRPLDAGGLRGAVAVRACARHVLLDYDLVFTDEGNESSRYARTLMVGSAMAGSEKVFSELWDRADALAQLDEDAWTTQLLATAKSRGQASASTSVVVRQALGYGQEFADALRRVLGEDQKEAGRSVLVAEGMRFCARVSVGQGKLSLDDMLAQDELLDMLGIGSITCDVAPRDLVDALKEEKFLRSNRFMMLLPFAIGRVRLATIPDDLLLEHATAWCAAHAM